MFRKLKNLIDQHAETSEHHVDENLKTHYFKTNTNEVIKVLQKMLDEMDAYKRLDVSTDRGEVTFEVTDSKKAFVVISVITVQPFRTAVDIVSSTESSLPFPLGYNHKVISQIYDYLKKHLAFLGTSLAEKLQE